MSLFCKVGENPCLLKFKVHAIWLKQPVGTKSGWRVGPGLDESILQSGGEPLSFKVLKSTPYG